MENFDLDILKENILKKYPLFGEELAKYPIVINNAIQTAGTDGKVIIVSEEFLNTLSLQQAMFILAHEFLHLKFAHHKRFDNLQNVEKDVKYWNIATDAVINANLVKDGFEMVEGGVDLPWAIDYTSEQVYRFLIKNKEKYSNLKPLDNHRYFQNNKQSKLNEQNNNLSDNELSNSEIKTNSSLDNSNNKENSKDNNQNKNTNNKSNKQSNNNSLSNKNKNASKNSNNQSERENNENNDYSNNGFDIKTKDFSKDNEKDVLNKNRDVRKQIAKQKLDKIKQNLINQQEMQKDKFYKPQEKSVCDWKVLLKKEFDKEDLMWSQRRSVKANNYGYRLEDFVNDERPITEVILDTSSSVSRNLLITFLKQVKALLCDTDIIVGTFSTYFNGWHQIKTEQDIDNLEFSIGGGTNFNEASKAFSLDPKINKICFTDGEDYWAEDVKDKRRDIIWVCFGNKDFKPDYGKVIYVSQKEILNNDSEEFENKEF